MIECHQLVKVLLMIVRICNGRVELEIREDELLNNSNHLDVVRVRRSIHLVNCIHKVKGISQSLICLIVIQVGSDEFFYLTRGKNNQQVNYTRFAMGF